MNRNLLLTICLSVAINGFAQLPSKVEVGRPAVLAKPLISEKDVASVNASNNWGQNNKRNLFWNAWSDRAGNTTYKGPSSSSGVKTRLEFNERVRIAKIENNFALVYVEKQNEVQYPNIYANEDKGWVPMSNLLLWESCPANEKGILNKALIVVNLGDKVSDADNLFKIYTNPNKQSDKGFATSSVNFRFVMKEDKTTGMVLLSNESTLSGTSDQMLYGWFNKESYVKWNQRSCLEPNWDRTEVTYFGSNKEKIHVYQNGNLAGDEIINPFTFGDITNSDGPQPDRYRMPKGSLRYPILDKNNQTNENNYYCNVFAQNGSLSTAAQHNDSIIRFQNTAVKNKEGVNLIIAIDGTRSMEPYYKPVKDAIKEGYSYYANKNLNVKIGIVIYRDYLDGQYLTEVLSLKDHNDAEIARFLDNGGNGKYGIKSAPGDDVPEALYEGLMAATDRQKMKFGSKESNLLLVIGDCGNRLNDKRSPAQSAIIDRLINNNFQVVAFQVRRLNQPAYNWFQKQMGEIITKNIKSQTEGLGINVAWEPKPHGFELNSAAARKFYIGSLMQPSLGKDMDVKLLTSFVVRSLDDFSEAIVVQRELMLNPAKANDKDSTEARVNLKFLEKQVGKKYVDFMMRTNSIMSAPGYTPKSDKRGHDYWKTVVYISTAELDGLLARLDGVYKAAQNSDYNNREPYVNAFKGIVRAMIPDISDERLNAMSQEEIMAQVVGLNASTQTTSKHTLQEIVNPKVVDTQEYSEMVRSFAIKYKALQSVKTSNYPFKLDVNRVTYYWIPTDMIP